MATETSDESEPLDASRRQIRTSRRRRKDSGEHAKEDSIAVAVSTSERDDVVSLSSIGSSGSASNSSLRAFGKRKKNAKDQASGHRSLAVSCKDGGASSDDAAIVANTVAETVAKADASLNSKTRSTSESETEPVGHVTISCVKQVVECSRCSCRESLFWRTATDGGLVCVSCSRTCTDLAGFSKDTSLASSGFNANNGIDREAKEDAEEYASQGGSDSPATPLGSVDNDEAEDVAACAEAEDNRNAGEPARGGPSSPRKREVRKGTRMKTAKSVKNLVKGRRTMLFKKAPPAKSSPIVAHFITTPYIRHKGSYLQAGDIVSMLGDDGEIYYAQLRSFLMDQFGEISATITWLIPTERSPSDGSFEPASFVIGPEEDFPRELRSMCFECHAPSDYYLSRDRPVLFDERKACRAFIWSSLGEHPKAVWDDASPSSTQTAPSTVLKSGSNPVVASDTKESA